MRNVSFPSELRFNVENRSVPVSRLEASQFRLDAPAFVSSDELRSLLSQSIKSRPLVEVADVFTVYIQSPALAYVKPFSQSRPYMTTSELAEYQLRSPSHVSLVADPRLLGWEIKRGNIVVSRSGRVGEAYWVDKKLDGSLVGDSFRVVPKIEGDGPFIYAVLASDFARDFLSGSAYGSVVDHASVDQLRKFPVPELSRSIKGTISSTINDAIAARDEAYDLLDEAQRQLLGSNGLPTLYEEAGKHENGLRFNISSEKIVGAEASEYRLEAHFYNPMAQLAIANLRAHCPNTTTVGQLSRDVILGSRFKRNYVESAYGTPFLSGKNIIQMRSSDVKYLSTSETDGLADMLVARGWILVTCSGTIGRTCFVWNNFEGFAASQHILRIVPNEDVIDPGYLYAFLSSEYGYEQIIRFRYGSVIDEIDDQQLRKVIVPRLEPSKEKKIGDLIRRAYERRAEALRLEERAQKILLGELMPTKPRGSQHV